MLGKKQWAGQPVDPETESEPEEREADAKHAPASGRELSLRLSLVPKDRPRDRGRPLK